MIKDKILQIKNDLLLRPKSPVQVLRGRFSGATALVVSAGPSASYWKQVYNSFKEKPLVACVKHVIEIDAELMHISDLHFVNTYNLKCYQYNRKNILSFYTKNYGERAPIQPWDVCFEIDPHHGSSGKKLSRECNFEDWTLQASGIYRPVGPGIMHESVLYTLLHLGISTIVTVGWDIASLNGSNQHFNEAHVREDEVNLKTYRDLKVRRAISMLRLNNAYRLFYHYAGYVYNRISMPADEPALVSNSLIPLSAWLESKGVELRCCSNSPWIPDSLACRMGIE